MRAIQARNSERGVRNGRDFPTYSVSDLRRGMWCAVMALAFEIVEILAFYIPHSALRIPHFNDDRSVLAGGGIEFGPGFSHLLFLTRLAVWLMMRLRDRTLTHYIFET
jgi:hypothetical protein